MESASRRLSLAALGVAVVLALTGCGGGSDGKKETSGDVQVTAMPVAEASAVPSDAKVVTVTVDGDSVTPSGEKVTVQRNQPIVFEIDAAEAGELHVHSSPAQAIEYPAGKSRAQISIDKPGVVEAEIEDTGSLVVQLAVE